MTSQHITAKSTARADKENNYYQDTRRVDLSELGSLSEDLSVDVCIVGGGITGCSAALSLVKRGFSVALLEAEFIGFGASGRSGGQIITGLSLEMEDVEKRVDKETANALWSMTLEACDLVKSLVESHDIPCDYRRGYLHAAIKPRQGDQLRKHRDHMAQTYDYHALNWLEGEALEQHLVTDAYVGALHDTDSGHLHPLNYVCGLAKAASREGAQLYTSTRVTEIRQKEGKTSVVTDRGHTVSASYVIQATNAYSSKLFPKLDAYLMRVPSYIVATEPLNDEQLAQTIPSKEAVCDVNMMLDYYRMSADNRLLLGGRQSLSEAAKRMATLFPVLKDTRLTHYWSGKVGVTRANTPMFGRVTDTIYYAQGYCGHGMALATLAGQLLAESISGQAERMDMFSQLKTKPFPVGEWLHGPVIELAKAWYRLKDRL